MWFRKLKEHPFFLLFTSILITLFLFFIDEGYYDFRWMAAWGNWVAFLLYLLCIWLGQTFIARIILRTYRGKGKAWAILLLGSAIGISSAILLIFSNA